jgi:hypothetical protein
MAYGMSMHSDEILLNAMQCQYVAFQRHDWFSIQNASARSYTLCPTRKLSYTN